MCGIAGLVDSASVARFESVLDRLSHRGPDDRNFVTFPLAGRFVHLFHTRLSINDVSTASRQPMISRVGSQVIIFNGEIYNFKSLRASMERRNVQFTSRGDSEVLLNGLTLYGLDFLKKVNGIYAFAWFDMSKGEIHLVRDHLGIKPIYYSLSEGKFAFASEIQAIGEMLDNKIEVRHDFISEFLLNGFLYEPRTAMVDVHKVPPGMFVTFDIRNNHISFRNLPKSEVYFESSEPIYETLAHQIRCETSGDVPGAIFFSSGIDSSVVASASPVDLDLIFLDYSTSDRDNWPRARTLAERLGKRIHRVQFDDGLITRDTALRDFREVAHGICDPISDFTYLAVRRLSRYAKEKGFKFVLCGMGGDEIFAGYPRYSLCNYYDIIKSLRYFIAAIEPVLSRIPGFEKKSARLKVASQSDDFARFYTSLIGYLSSEQVLRLTGDEMSIHRFFDNLMENSSEGSSSRLRQALHFDRSGFLAHNLTVVDRASMAEGLEVRVPLLGQGVVRWADSMPDSKLRGPLVGKLPLRSFLTRAGFDPGSNVGKAAFNPPLDTRVNAIGRDYITELFFYGPLSKFLAKEELMNIVSDHFNGRRNCTYQLWQLLFLSEWLDSH